MRDCSNAGIRDALPDLMHGTLPAERRAAVRAHVDACADCRAELELLMRVRGTVAAPRVDVARIVAALPAYRSVGSWRRAFRPMWQAAAAVLLIVGGALVLQRGRAPEPRGSFDTVATMVPALALPVPSELSLGETFHDVTDTELRALVNAIDTLDAIPLEEPASITVPLVPTEEL